MSVSPSAQDPLASHSIRTLCAYLRRTAGISVGADKLYFIESRVLPLVRREKLSGIPELVRLLEQGKSPKLAAEIIEALTVNETYFFRDKRPFDAFRDVMLPKLMAARAAEKRIRIWSAACSTGQEPYSLAMILTEAASRLAGWRIEILATDLAEHVLARAVKGSYSQFEVQRGMPAPQLLRHFHQTNDAWELSEQVRSLVTFRQFNLLSDFATLGRFDVILCRNVLIYFDTPRKTDILKRLTRILAPDGYLVLGASEGIIGLGTDLVQDQEHRSFYVHGKSAVAPAAARPASAGDTTEDVVKSMEAVVRQLAHIGTSA